jgi:hypothetical protein
MHDVIMTLQEVGNDAPQGSGIGSANRVMQGRSTAVLELKGAVESLQNLFDSRVLHLNPYGVRRTGNADLGISSLRETEIDNPYGEGDTRRHPRSKQCHRQKTAASHGTRFIPLCFDRVD